MRDVSASAPARRVPPQDLDAEKAVLSAVLLDNDALHAVYEEIRPEDFYHPAHEKLFRAMIALGDAGEPVDLHTLSDHLTTQKQLDDIGGPVFLAEIADYEATAANVLHHARIVRDKSIKRGVIAAASEIVEAAFDQTDRSDRLLDHAESKIFELGQERSRTTFRALQDEMHDTMDHVEHLMNRGEELTGLATGFQDLDKLTGGLQRGDLIIIAARPSMGKTALALNIARNAASEPYHKKVAVFSLEMTTRALVLRLLSAEAQVDASAFRTGFISVNDYGRLSGAASRLSEANIWIDDSGAIGVLEMKAKSRRMAAERGLDLIIVDYMQLMHGDQNKDSREQEIAEISRGLKALAKELDIPVIALSQLNRGPETRSAEDKRPRLSDLRESGAIEQDADVIGFIYRDVVYHPDADAADAELIIAKQRNGPTDTVRLHFEGRFARFNSVSRRTDTPAVPYGDTDAFATSDGDSPF
ncbi:MAG: replicative DNA helicase [Deltaproteobacteria bacterium]|nr:MAG: replicative DNA helicase [Deltaproteobacteria bacterium]